MTFVYVLLGLTAAVLLTFALWRVASSRRSLPCPSWLRWMVELDNPFTRTNRAAEIISHLDLQRGMAVLDVGCGPGRLAIPLAKAVGPTGRVVALDVQQGMLDRVAARAASEGLENLELIRAVVGRDSLEDSAFDRALLITVLGEVPDRHSAMRGVYQALKPGGLLAVTELIFDPHFQRRSTVQGLAEACGLEVEAIHGNCIAYTMILRRAMEQEDGAQS